MKQTVGFKLNWAEMLFVLTGVFSVATFLTTNIEDKFIYIGLVLLPSLGILIKKRIKIHINNKLKK